MVAGWVLRKLNYCTIFFLYIHFLSMSLWLFMYAAGCDPGIPRGGMSVIKKKTLTAWQADLFKFYLYYCFLFFLYIRRNI